MASASGEQPKFYGRRRGRALGPKRAGLLGDLLPRLAIAKPESGPLDPARLFPAPPREVWLEIGFGAGEHLLAQARANPAIGLIGCEVFRNGVASALAGIADMGIANVRLYPEDARGLLPHLAEASIARLFLLFPDPWPKRRHAARRLVSAASLDLFARLLCDGGELRLASDDAVQITWALAWATRHPAWQWLAERRADWLERPIDWPPTRYEEKARRAGRAPHFFRFRRRERDITIAG